MGRDQLGLFGEVLRDQLISVDQRLAHSVRAVSVAMVALGSFASVRVKVVFEAATALFNRAIDVAFETGVEFEVVVLVGRFFAEVLGVVRSDPPSRCCGCVVVMLVVTTRQRGLLLVIQLVEVSLALVFLAVLTKVVLVLGLLKEGRLDDS